MPTPTCHLLTGDDAAIAEALASLSEPERAIYAGFSFPKRQRDWLLGRLASKQALRRAAGQDWALDEISILPLPHGGPTFQAPGDALAGWHLSLSHGHGMAAAAVAPAPVGIDMERMRSVPEGGWRFFLSPDEREWLAQAPLGPQSELVVWALKEAAYKTLQGAVSGVLGLNVEQADAGTACLAHPEGRLYARHGRWQDFCLALATPWQERSWLEALTFPGA